MRAKRLTKLSKRRRLVVGTIVMLASLVSRISIAGDPAAPTAQEIAVARYHFDIATVAEKEGRWEDAINELGKAIAIKETAGLRYHLGVAKEKLGQLVEAMLEFERAAGLIRSGVTNEEIQRFIEPKLKEIHKRVPRLTVRVAQNVKDVSLQIDGASVHPDLLGAPIPLNPGAHGLALYAPGYRSSHIQVNLGEGATVTQSIELVPESSLADANARLVQKEDGHGFSARTWVLISEGAVAVTGLGTGIGYRLAADSAQNRYDEAAGRIEVSQKTCASQTPRSRHGLRYPPVGTRRSRP